MIIQELNSIYFIGSGFKRSSVARTFLYIFEQDWQGTGYLLLLQLALVSIIIVAIAISAAARSS